MKPLAPYFGNRLASVTKKSKTTRSRKAAQMEALESRILLSGITSGKDYSSVSFSDADGDKVTVSMTNGGTFQLSLLAGDTNNNDIETLTITKGGANAVLNITVAAQKIDGGYTDAISNIDSIVANSSVTALKAINSNGAALDSINLGTATLGSIKLSATNSIALDRNALTQSALDVDLGDVTAKTVSTIQIVSSKKVQAGGGMNFDGAITTTSGSLTLIGANSLVQGQVDSASTIFKTAGFGAGGGTKTSGDITLNFSVGSTVTGTFESTGGNIHIGGAAGTSFDGAKFIAAKSISGTGSSTTDVVTIGGKVIAGGVTFAAGTTFAGLKVTGGDVATLNVSAATSIGNLEATNGDLGNLTLSLSDAAGTIGNITAGDDVTLAANISAASIGNISGDAITGGKTITATTGNIGNLTASTGVITADLTATAGNIGNVSAIGAITSTITLSAASASIGNISGASLSSDLSAGSIGNVALTGALSVALDSTIGSIGNVSATSLTYAGAGDAITSAGSIGNITASAGIISDSITAATGIGNISVTTSTAGANAIGFGITATTGNIGNITATATTGNAINAAILATTGNIGNVSATVTTGVGINNTITATAGSIGNVTASATTGDAIASNITAGTNIGNVTATTTGDSATAYAIATGVTLDAATAIGNVSASATGKAGIGSQDFTINAKTIGNVTILGTESTAGADNAVAFNGAVTIGDGTATTGTGAIGNISITGDIGAALNITGRNSGSGYYGTTVGNLTVTDDDIADTGTVTLTRGISIGNISTASGDLVFVETGNTLLSFGNISIADELTIDGGTALTTMGSLTAETVNLSSDTFGGITTMGKIDIGQFDNLTTGNINFGAGGASTTIGYILIDQTATASADNITFRFQGWTNSSGTTSNASTGTAGIVVGIVDSDDAATNLLTGTAVGRIGNAGGQTSGDLTFLYA